METRRVETYTATIAVGLKNDKTDIIQLMTVATNWLHQYVDEVGLCVTLTKTEYIYSKGGEPGFLVGLINYPRFPSSKEDIRKHAMKIAETLLDKLHQKRVSIIFPDETLTIGEF
jgi:hypothetical protein